MSKYNIIDRKEVAKNIMFGMAACKEQLGRKKFDDTDYAKIKVTRNFCTMTNAAVTMIQQENAEKKMEQVEAKMKLLGYKKNN